MAQIDKQRDKAVQTDGSPVALFNFFVTVGADCEQTLFSFNNLK